MIVYLDQNKNDVVVAITTLPSGQQGSSEITPFLQSLTVPNVPVGKAVRLGVVIANHLLEVYVNGYLLHSKAFTSDVQAS